MNEMLRLENVCFSYQEQDVLRDVSFSVKSGDFIGVIGPNGSGKSTLLRAASKILVPKRGKVFFQGKDIVEISQKKFAQNAAFVPQETLVSFPFTVWEIVLMGRIPHLNRLQIETRNDFNAVKRALILTDTDCLINKRIDQLSGGERQRVIIAKSLAQEPCLLFLDEPTSHLDLGHQIQILNLLAQLNQEKSLTIVSVFHDLNLASQYCNRIIFLNQGCLFKDGAPEEVITKSNIEDVYGKGIKVEVDCLGVNPYLKLLR